MYLMYSVSILKSHRKKTKYFNWHVLVEFWQKFLKVFSVFVARQWFRSKVYYLPTLKGFKPYNSHVTFFCSVFPSVLNGLHVFLWWRSHLTLQNVRKIKGTADKTRLKDVTCKQGLTHTEILTTHLENPCEWGLTQSYVDICVSFNEANSQLVLYLIS